MTRIAIWGASGHALVVADIVRLLAEREIVGFLDDVNRSRHGTEFCGSRILGGSDQLDRLHDMNVNEIIIAIGNCEARLQAAALAGEKGLRLGNAIHPRAVIATDTTIGAGTVVAAGAVINPGASVGRNVIVNSCSSIDHECIIEDGAHIGPGAHLGGRVTVRSTTWIGIGAVVRDRVTIGAGSIVGAGAVVVNDIPPGVVAYGVPARVIRENRTA